ncbi:MAG: N-acetylmuramoyl-L-alanine amidase, partial [Bacilli bacterium]
TLYDTGVAYEGERPTVTIEADGFFYINDKKTTVVAPTGTTTINTLGMVCFKGTNGNYVIPTTWRGTSYGQVICARGGNLNGIGIETAVNMGSDVYLTWQTTAKFVAELLVKHNLTPDRVWFHNNFSNKPCPRSMMTAGLVDDFLEMVYTEYDVLKNYDDYSITFTSSNPDIIDNSGRVIGAPNFTTNVTYTVTVEKSGVSESIVLNALVVGKYN